ncbi:MULTISPECIES: hypothetical protein [unclassified Clostridium]|uniref:hypothetical protein n=1 Tax=unclassified Clostridium TaxID=2614128 RepID=UPI0025BA44FD|nr:MULTISPECIES: hypothetical protein [unclassified Clostridium]
MQSLRDRCNMYLGFHVIITMTDGSMFDGIIDDVDMDGVTMLVGEDMMEDGPDPDPDQYRQFRPRRRRRMFRRFRRRRFPFASIVALSLLPFPFIF